MEPKTPRSPRSGSKVGQEVTGPAAKQEKKVTTKRENQRRRLVENRAACLRCGVVVEVGGGRSEGRSGSVEVEADIKKGVRRSWVDGETLAWATKAEYLILKSSHKSCKLFMQ